MTYSGDYTSDIGSPGDFEAKQPCPSDSEYDDVSRSGSCTKRVRLEQTPNDIANTQDELIATQSDADEMPKDYTLSPGSAQDDFTVMEEIDYIDVMNKGKWEITHEDYKAMTEVVTKKFVGEEFLLAMDYNAFRSRAVLMLGNMDEENDNLRVAVYTHIIIDQFCDFIAITGMSIDRSEPAFARLEKVVTAAEWRLSPVLADFYRNEILTPRPAKRAPVVDPIDVAREYGIEEEDVIVHFLRRLRTTDNRKGRISSVRFGSEFVHFYPMNKYTEIVDVLHLSVGDYFRGKRKAETEAREAAREMYSSPGDNRGQEREERQQPYSVQANPQPVYPQLVPQQPYSGHHHPQQQPHQQHQQPQQHQVQQQPQEQQATPGQANHPDQLPSLAQVMASTSGRVVSGRPVRWKADVVEGALNLTNRLNTAQGTPELVQQVNSLGGFVNCVNEICKKSGSEFVKRHGHIAGGLAAPKTYYESDLPQLIEAAKETVSKYLPGLN
mmetsp:Transcript_24044/g.44607  ORF Transcript_24044/g.44607 Transcript_24044/m.44607 type:complete len:496 (-) Transcript_24044:1094-2581(-)